jgi:hypothetical protein
LLARWHGGHIPRIQRPTMMSASSRNYPAHRPGAAAGSAFGTCSGWCTLRTSNCSLRPSTWSLKRRACCDMSVARRDGERGGETQTGQRHVLVLCL